jgi:hypothetical protein
MPNCTVSNLSQGCLQAVFYELNKLFNLIKTSYCADHPLERGLLFLRLFYRILALSTIIYTR